MFYTLTRLSKCLKMGGSGSINFIQFYLDSRGCEASTSQWCFMVVYVLMNVLFPSFLEGGIC